RRGATQDLLRRLSAQLLGPVRDRLDGRRVIVTAEGALHYVPFAALPVLGDICDVGYIPSASMLAAQRRRRLVRPPPAQYVAVLADPVFSLADPRVGGSVRPDVFTVPRLPASAGDADTLRRLLPSERVHMALGFDASRERLLA